MQIKPRIKLVKRAIWHWFQRRAHGWDDSELWSLDYSLERWIVPRLKRFKEILHGYPAEISWEEWNQILDDMIEGFTYGYTRDDWEFDVDDVESKRRFEKLDNAYKLLEKWHSHLWD